MRRRISRAAPEISLRDFKNAFCAVFKADIFLSAPRFPPEALFRK
jgi:hypothetical protein